MLPAQRGRSYSEADDSISPVLELHNYFVIDLSRGSLFLLALFVSMLMPNEKIVDQSEEGMQLPKICVKNFS